MQQNKKLDSAYFDKKIYREKRKIITALLNSEPRGMSHQDLAKKLDIHRDTLRKDMKNLSKVGIVRREGQKGKYHLSKVMLSSELAKGLVLGANFTGNILGKEGKVLFTNAMVYDYNSKNQKEGKDNNLGNFYDSKDYYLKYFTPRFDERSKVEENIFEFINQIGAYFLYTFLTALEVSNIESETLGDNSKSEEWLDGALNSIHLRIFEKFKDILFKFKPDQLQLKEIDDYIKENKLPKNDFVIKRTLLINSYTHLYPYICHTLYNKTEELVDDLKFYNTKIDQSIIRINRSE